VPAGSDAALAGSAEQPLRPMTGEVDEAFDSQAAGVHMVEHHRHQRLHARHAGWGSRIWLRLLFEGVRRMVGTEHIDYALRHAGPHAIAVTDGTHRRV